MDQAEAQAKKYLEAIGLGPVRFEPDGNHPPDLLTSAGIAVEVRRLNQHFEHKGESVALEYDAFPILNGFRRVLQPWESRAASSSWWVSYQFHRPVPMWKELEPAIAEVLRNVDSTGVAPSEVAIARGFKLLFHPSSHALAGRFLFAGYSDHNSGGWLMHELLTNVQRCITEKTRKIEPYRSKYSRWWLVLVDHIGLGNSSLEAALFDQKVRTDLMGWDKVLLLNPYDETRASSVQAVP